jgi:hypothetical protein
MSQTLLSDSDIRDALADVAAELERMDSEAQTVIVVGGSYMAFVGLRQATKDVDSLSAVAAELREAVATVGRSRGWNDRWLNDDAKGYRPNGFDDSECVVVAKYAKLTVMRPSADTIFVMKLRAARAPDRADMVRLWPETSFTTALDAVAAHDAAYPEAIQDEHLEGFVQDIVDQAG